MAKPELNSGHKTKVDQQTHAHVATPSLFKVIMHNDDYTTMEFVIEVLQEIFNKSATEAEKIMLSIHFQARGCVEPFPMRLRKPRPIGPD